MPALESKPDFSIRRGAISLTCPFFGAVSVGWPFDREEAGALAGLAGSGLGAETGCSTGLRAGAFWGVGCGLGFGFGLVFWGEAGFGRAGWTVSSRLFRNLRLLSSSSVCCAGPSCKGSRVRAQRQTVKVERKDTR